MQKYKQMYNDYNHQHIIIDIMKALVISMIIIRGDELLE